MVPARRHRYHRPVILGVLILAVAAPALSRLVTSEMGGRKTQGPPRGWAWFALVAVLLYDTGRWVAHDRAIASSMPTITGRAGRTYQRVSRAVHRNALARHRGRRWVHLRSARGSERRFRRCGGHTEYPAISSPAIDGPAPRARSRSSRASISCPSGPCCRWTIRCGLSCWISASDRCRVLDSKPSRSSSPEGRVDRAYFSFGMPRSPSLA